MKKTVILIILPFVVSVFASSMLFAGGATKRIAAKKRTRPRPEQRIEVKVEEFAQARTPKQEPAKEEVKPELAKAETSKQKTSEETKEGEPGKE